MEKIEGFIEHIVFRNQDNGYTVMNLVCEQEEITCVGTFHFVGEGEFVTAAGVYKEHPVYGKQFLAESLEVKIPEDIVSVERYLASGAIKGIGAALAARIVRRFKEDTFRIIEEEPERLAEIKGISERKAREIAEQVEDKSDMRKAMIFLQQYAITTGMAVKIYNRYGQDVYRILKENPYKMADDIQGIGFKIADEIAAKVGLRSDSMYRIRSGILYILQRASGEGHTCLPEETMLSRTSELLQTDRETIEKQVMDLAMERMIVMKQSGKQNYIYIASLYYQELNSAKMLFDLNLKSNDSEQAIQQRIQNIEEESEICLDKMQKTAVLEAVKNGALVLTGGPGTGKTTTINAIIQYFAAEEMDILLAAPTGRAAKRMTEATGYEAKTIHRLLENSNMPENSSSGVIFERNEQNPLEADVIIIDEMSMVDIFLFHALLKAITVGMRLIMVGDVNQLPSVGPGSVLKDIIESHCFPVVMLTKIFRQALKSDIVMNAHKINRGEPVLADNKSKDFFLLKRQEANVIISVLITLIQKKLPSYVEAAPYEIQVLTPMRKGLLGVERINRILQEYLNPKANEKKEKEHGEGLFREGDKVMQIKNNYQLEWEICNKYGVAEEKGTGVFNGDMGTIKEINTFAETLTVEYDEKKRVEYSFQNLEELELAYAITIHKSQGSEYPAVVLPLLTGPRMLMNRNLLYTAVTRARKCVTIVGSEDCFQKMIQNENEQKRYSGLMERIHEIENSLKE